MPLSASIIRFHFDDFSNMAIGSESPYRCWLADQILDIISWS
jgi:hypothetical protein